MACEPRKRDVALIGHESVSQSCSIDEELEVVLSADVSYATDFLCLVDGSVFGGEGDIHHSWLSQMVATLIVLELLHEGLEVVGTHLPIVIGKGDDAMSAGLYGTCLVHVDVGGIGGDNSLTRGQHGVDDGGIGLRSTSKEEDVGVGCLAGESDLLFGTLRPLVEPVGETLCGVGVDEVLQHFRMGTVVIVAFEGKHGGKLEN